MIYSCTFIFARSLALRGTSTSSDCKSERPDEEWSRVYVVELQNKRQRSCNAMDGWMDG